MTPEKGDRMYFVGALLIFVITLALIMIRPKGLSEAYAAGGGAVVMLLVGYVHWGQAAQTLVGDWNVFLFFLGMMTLAALADNAGFFNWTAALAAQSAKGSTRRLFLNVFILGALISTFLSNDATALILTPIVYTLVTRLRLRALPFMFACTFIADTASFVLPVSNPINIIVLSSFHLNLIAFMRLLFPASLLVITINIGLFFFLFRRDIGGQFEGKRLGTPEEAIPHRPYFLCTCVVLGLTAIAYVIASLYNWPLSLVACGGGALLLAGSVGYRRLELKRLAREISWPIFLFIAGMFLVVKGVENVGLTNLFAGTLAALTGRHLGAGVLVTTFGAAIGANLINNVPMAVVMVATLNHLGRLRRRVQTGMAAATMLGCDLGPNITTVGSLATIMWMLILRRKGLDVSSVDYFKIGIVVAPLMLLGGGLIIWGLSAA
jgi:arsenical pump membrane protein